MKYGIGLTLTLLTAFAAPALFAAAEAPVEFSAYYEARTNGMRGDAERHLIAQDDGYRMNVSLEARMAGIKIGELNQSSEFTLEGDRIVPQIYSYTISGITSEVQEIRFDWQNGSALSRRDDEAWDLDIEPGVVDNLSYQLALARAVERVDSQEEQEFTLQVINRDEIRSHRYRIVGEEQLDSPIGLLNTIKLERVRDDDSGRTTEIWLASDWNYLLARLEQHNPGGLRIELKLENAIVDDQQVQPL